MTKVLSIALFILLGWQIPQLGSAIDLSQCDVYLHKARELNCGPRNYLVQFGYKYCRTFVENNEEFTEHGQVVAEQIRSCLIRELEQNDRLQCRNVRALSVRAHVDCYLQGGFCELGIFDQLVIFDIIWPELFNARMRKSAFQIVERCSEVRAI